MPWTLILFGVLECKIFLMLSPLQAQVYMLKAEGIAFRFLPDPLQIKNALEVCSFMELRLLILLSYIYMCTLLKHPHHFLFLTQKIVKFIWYIKLCFKTAMQQVCVSMSRTTIRTNLLSSSFWLFTQKNLDIGVVCECPVVHGTLLKTF
jgi:hypothetical protein